MFSVGPQAAAQCYIDLIIKESDNNVKLIVLDRLIELKEHPTHERVLQVGFIKLFFCFLFNYKNRFLKIKTGILFFR